MKIKNVANSLYVLLLLTMMFCSSAFAGDATGLWRSTSGATIKLWANMRQAKVNMLQLPPKQITILPLLLLQLKMTHQCSLND